MNSKLVLSALCLTHFTLHSAMQGQPAPTRATSRVAAESIIVRGELGGDIFGFDVDPNGSEGLLCEAFTTSDGTVHAAVETFDQTTGAITAVAAKSDSRDDFVALTVAGQSIGLVEREHPKSFSEVIRRFRTLNPIEAHQVSAKWTPPLDQDHVINQVKPSQADTPEVAVYALSVSDAPPLIFTSDLATNTFGTVIPITNPVFTTEAPPVICYDNVRNQVIMGHDFPSEFILPPRIGFVDLASGNLRTVIGLGLGVINGIAVDTEDGILCTDTSADSEIQFYDLATTIGDSQKLPGAKPDQNTANGADIAFDPLNKLFLVAQPFSDGLLDNGSSVLVYDIAGNLLQSIDGLNFQGGFSVFPIHISLNPNRRTGWVPGPDLTKSLQSFSY